MPRLLLGLAAALVGAGLIGGFDPAGGAGLPYNSDHAIPVLMANHRPWDLFHLYFYGMDRYGAWPFALAHLAGLAFGFAWTPSSLHVAQAIFLVGGALPAALLGGETPALGGIAYLAAIALPGAARLNLDDPAAPYAWQLPALLWSWWLLRRWAERRRLAFPAAALAHFLAIWSSTLSAPMLAALAPLEAWRAGGRPSLRPLARALAPAAAGLAGEVLVRQLYHRWALTHFGGSYTTRLRLDWGHLGENAAHLLANLVAPEAWPYLGLALGAAALAAVTLRRGRGDAADRELAWLALGLAVLACVPLPAIAAVDHVRANGYHFRYLTPTLCLARAGACAGLALAARTVAAGRAGRVEPALAALAAVGLWWLRPAGGPGTEYARRVREAEALVRLAPGSPLVNGYWQSYALAGVLPPGELTAIPAEGEYDRTPFERAELRAARTVIVGNGGSLGARWGSGPPAELAEYGVQLELANPELYADGEDRFALYRAERPRL